MAKKYRVIKRSEEIVNLDVTKIREVIQFGVQGLDVSSLELESNMEMKYRDLITTKEIQENLIHTCLKLVSIEVPDWRIVAGRLLMFDLYKEVKYTRDYEKFGYDNYTRFIKQAIKKGHYDPKIEKLYSKEELKEIGKMLKPEYDLDFDYAGANLMINRYLIEDKNKAFELPQEAFLTIALLIEQNQPKAFRLQAIQDTYEKIAKRKISLATPILINLRKPNGNLSSCFINMIDDSLDSIMYTIDAIGQISKNGGGVGTNLSKVRASGSWIQNHKGASGGVLPWIKIINDTAVGVNQLGKRCVSDDSEVEIIDKVEINNQFYQVDDEIEYHGEKILVRDLLKLKGIAG